MCRLRRENFSRHQVAVTLVTRSSKQHHQTSKDHHSDREENQPQRALNKEIKNSTTTVTRKGSLNNYNNNGYESNSFSSYESKDIGTGLEVQDSFPTKAAVHLESKLSHDGSTNGESTNSDTCRARKILRKVTLRSGLKSGDFSDYGQVPDMHACVKRCCAQKTCDVSLLLNNHCYTLHCYKPELCKIIPAHSVKLDAQLAFVIRAATDDQSNTQVKKKTSSLNRGTCPHGAIFSGVSLKGGRKAGKFQILAGAKDMRTCIQKCCARPSCQVAWLLGDYCYSVACYDKCITVKKSSGGIRSQLSLLTRKAQQPENDSKLKLLSCLGVQNFLKNILSTLDIIIVSCSVMLLMSV